MNFRLCLISIPFNWMDPVGFQVSVYEGYLLDIEGCW